MNILGDVILFIHLFILIFVLVIPFSGNQPLLLLNFALLMAIAFHWIMNDTTCALTLLEKVVRGETDDKRTFFGRVMGPVYSFGSEKLTTQVVLFILIMITLYKLDVNYVKDSFTCFLNGRRPQVRSG
jgi:hypothetical protein